MRITERVFFYKGRGEEKLIRGAGSSNVIVLRTDRQVMVDTGLIVAGSFEDLRSGAAADGLDLSKTRAVLHTHSHWDHITGDCIVQASYGAKVYSHPWEKPIVESQEAGFRAMLLDSGEFYKEIFGLPPIFYKLLLRYLGGTYSGLHVDEVLNGGEELDFGLRIVPVHTPGHSPGHMAYYLPEERVLAGGDLIDLESGTCADLNNPHSNYADGLATLRKVRDMDVEAFLPAHGEPVKGGDNVRNLLDRMIKNTLELTEAIKGFLSKRDGTLTEIFKELMPGTPFTLKAMKMMQVLAVLNHLQQEKEVTFRKSDGRLVWSLSR